MKDWQSMAHVKWECKYHIVFIPKYRKKKLYGRLHKRIGGIFHEVCRYKGIELLEALGRACNARPCSLCLFPTTEWKRLLSVREAANRTRMLWHLHHLRIRNLGRDNRL